MTDRGEQLCRAAHARHEVTVAKTVAALRSLERAREPVTFGGVARRAGVSRSWLYRQTGLRSEIEQLRSATPSRPRAATSAHPASDESNRQRLMLLREELARLTAENAALRERLARKLGAERAAAVTHSR
ncbi:MAG: DUF6262 family protein [Steroidobacteraceae bacterium]